MIDLYIFLVALQALDIYTTMVVLGQGGYERNKLLAYLFVKFGPLKTLLSLKLAVMVAVWVYARHDGILMGVICFGYFILVIWNFSQYKK